MIIADIIADLIEQMLADGGGSAEIKRNDLAAQIGCVPSQVSYVIGSRFTAERGYTIESKRGGGGCIRIVRVQMHKNEYLMHFFHAVGSSIGERESEAYMQSLLGNGIITERESALLCASLSSGALERIAPEYRNNIRADILRQIIMALMK
jgi:Transcriptional repressor of class III stress genes